MQDQEQRAEVFVSDLEERLLGENGGEHRAQTAEKLEQLYEQVRLMSEQPQTESDFKRIQTVMSGITAAQEVMRVFPVINTSRETPGE